MITVNSDLDAIYGNDINKKYYGNKYLTFETKSDMMINFDISVPGGLFEGKDFTYLSYSFDEGTTWYNATTTKSYDLETSVSDFVFGTYGDEYAYFNDIKKISLKADFDKLAYYNEADDEYLSFKFYDDETYEAYVYGNVLSLIYSDDFYKHNGLKPEVDNELALSHIFESLNYGLMNVEHLVLPSYLTPNDSRCFEAMFDGCVSLTGKAPELNSSYIPYKGYAYMFNGCELIDYVKCLAEGKQDGSNTKSWLNNVSSYGTFVASKKANWTATGANGVPTNWDFETM